METNTTDSEGSQRRAHVGASVRDEVQHGIYVVATTLPATTRALRVAEALASEQRSDVTVLVSPPERVTVSSARAHVYDLPVEYESQQITPEVVKDLVVCEHAPADVQTTDTRRAGHLVSVLPPSSTVVLAGALHHFIETHEQRLARKLATSGYNVVFLPCSDE
jgi:hypothetical protein